ncbi:MAG TPA: solute carrier family 23 protein [Kiloniellales bacterium]|nr:solute carrier family 23 protein [Kiloniellales bacterium]
MSESERREVRYELTEQPPPALSLALAAQTVALILAGILLTPVIVLRAGGAESYAPWAIFAALVVSGLGTIVQSRPIGRIGSGYVLFMGTSGAVISVGVTAIHDGSVAMLMTLIVVSSLVLFPFAANLGLLRKVITPTVGGTAMMLIAVSVMPIAFGLLTDVPQEAGERSPGAPASALTTLAVIVGLSLFGARALKLWSPIIGLALGTAVAAVFGLVDATPLEEAPWIGLPPITWPGFDLSFGIDFWAILPAFVIVTVVGSIESFGDCIAIQRVSWRRPHAVDFRAVQGAIYADSFGSLFSGLSGTLPNTTLSTSVAVVSMTGVASRRVGIYGGLLLLALALFPKIAALILAVPNPVVGAYLIIVLVLLFIHGMALATEGGFSMEKTLILGLSFWLGVGFQDGAIFHDYLPDWAGVLLSNGMTAGTLCAILLTLLARLAQGHVDRLEVPLTPASVPRVHEFVKAQASHAGWDKAATNRLQLAAEEVLVVMSEKSLEEERERQLRIDAREREGSIELDIVVAPRGANLEDRLTLMATPLESPPEEAFAFRILASIVDEFHHQQYHGTDFVTLRVASRPL